MNNDTEQIFLINASENQSRIENQKVSESVSNQVNLENVEDFTNVCRTCATITEFVIPIFMGEGLQNNLADKIHKHLPIKVTEEDVLPRVVCYQCASTLLAWHELVQCCVQADNALKTRLAVILAKEEASNNEDKNLETDTNEMLKTANFITNIKDLLAKYFQISDIDSENSSLEFLCEKCSDLLPFSTMENFIEHLHSQHNHEFYQKTSTETFIRDNVSVVEMLATDEQFTDSEQDKDITTVKLQRIQCPFCESAFSSITRLTCHLNQHVNTCLEDGFTCCNTTYYNTKSLTIHLQDHNSINDTNTCQSCGFNASNADDLQEHISKKHGREETYIKQTEERLQKGDKCQKYIPAVCPECNKTFSNKYNMLVHMRRHRNVEEKFSCDRCSKSYKSQGSLRNHQKVTHEGILSFVCSHCGEAFPTRVARDVHNRIHTGDRPYTCTYCQKSYRAKNTLDRHIEIHLDIRKYECKICSKKFRKSTHLNYHLKTHRRKK